MPFDYVNFKIAESEARLRVCRILPGHPYHPFVQGQVRDSEIQGINVCSDNGQDVLLDLKLQSTGLPNHDTHAKYFI